MKHHMNKKMLNSLFGLTVLVLVCGFLARYLTDSETLADYAQKNPQIAYGSAQTDLSQNTEETLSETTNLPSHETSANDRMPSSETYTNDRKPSNGTSANDKKPSNETYTNNRKPDSPDTASDNSSSHIDKITEENPANAEENMSFQKEEADNVTKENSFYYQDLSDELIARITGISYPMSKEEADTFAIPAVNIVSAEDSVAVSYDDLCYLSVLHYDFNGEIQTGEIICNKQIAEDLVDIFYELYLNEYPIEKIRLIEEYNGDDTASMADNNTSCFNYRVVDGTTSLSKHALGCAIDINPFYNPYVVFNRNNTGETYISPAGSEIYADRSNDFAYKIDKNDLCYQLFKEHGFTWGGDWNSCKDYQHFQKTINE